MKSYQRPIIAITFLIACASAYVAFAPVQAVFCASILLFFHTIAGAFLALSKAEIAEPSPEAEPPQVVDDEVQEAIDQPQPTPEAEPPALEAPEVAQQPQVIDLKSLLGKLDDILRALELLRPKAPESQIYIFVSGCLIRENTRCLALLINNTVDGYAGCVEALVPGSNRPRRVELLKLGLLPISDEAVTPEMREFRKKQIGNW